MARYHVWRLVGDARVRNRRIGGLLETVRHRVVSMDPTPVVGQGIIYNLSLHVTETVDIDQVRRVLGPPGLLKLLFLSSLTVSFQVIQP